MFCLFTCIYFNISPFSLKNNELRRFLTKFLLTKFFSYKRILTKFMKRLLCLSLIAIEEINGL